MAKPGLGPWLHKMASCQRLSTDQTSSEIYAGNIWLLLGHLPIHDLRTGFISLTVFERVWYDGMPHPFTRWNGTTRDKLCAEVLTQFTNNRKKGDAKMLHTALQTGDDSHWQLQKSAMAEAGAPGAWAGRISPHAGSGPAFTR